MKDRVTGNTEAILAENTISETSPAQVEENLRLIEDLKFFLATAPANWQKNQIIRRYYLNHDEGFVSCVFWNNLYFITGTDIVRCIVYRFEQFGREITDRKKFEEGIFSDLRSLKCGSDAVLEVSKSPFLEFLYKNSCLRTQKKQKVFFWFSVPHDKLFAEALERDLKKEKMNQAGTTIRRSEPALSFQYDDSKPLYEQLVDHLESKKKLYASSEVSSVNGDDLDSQIPLVSSQATEVIEPQTFYIKEEDEDSENLNAIQVDDEGKDPNAGLPDDDFPLDYFPKQTSNEPFMIDPSIFTNPPDSYDGQYLIEQTYAKTPYSAAKFEVGFDEEIEEQYVPVSMPRQAQQQRPNAIAAAAGGGGTSYYPPHGVPITIPQQQQPFPYPITNGQYYDSQMDGSFNEIPTFSEYNPHQVPPHHLQPHYNPYYIGGPNPAGAYPPYGMVTTMPAGPMYYDPSQAQFADHYYAAFEDDGQEDGDDELYVPFEAPPIRHSPFNRGFPSFQAAAPPSASQPLSASRLRHQVVPSRSNQGRVMKPGKNLKHQYSRGNLRKMKNDLERKVSNPAAPEPNPTAISDQTGSSSGDLKTDECEYNSLPTPESTVPDPWNYNNHSRRLSGSMGSNGPGSNGLNDFLEDNIYDEQTEEVKKEKD